MSHVGEVTVTGNATRDSELVDFPDGGVTLRVSIAVQWRRFDRQTEKWVDDDSRKTFYDVVGINGDHARNAAASIKKGTPVIVTGRPCVRKWDGADKATGAPISGVANEIHAKAIGIDLHWGTAVYTKAERPQQGQAPQGAPQQYMQQPVQAGAPPVQYAQAPQGQYPAQYMQQPVQAGAPPVQYAQAPQGAPPAQYAQPQGQPQYAQPQGAPPAQYAQAPQGQPVPQPPLVVQVPPPDAPQAPVQAQPAAQGAPGDEWGF